MRVYAERALRLTTAGALHDVLRRLDRMPLNPAHDAVRDLLVDWGELESAAADALCRDVDDEYGVLAAWRAASDAVAEAACASWEGDAAGCRGSLSLARQRVERLTGIGEPHCLLAYPAEGFAYYAVTPEQYIAAARTFARTRTHGSVMCIGLRTIGSILAHIVAATLRRSGMPASVRSVRPRGRPFDRRLDVGAALRTMLATCSSAYFAIVDEGPGLSGSSFASAAELLADLDVEPARVVFFPSWEPPADTLQSVRGRVAWQRHPKVAASFDDLWLRSGRLFGAGAVEDLSGGAWRRGSAVAGSPAPPVQPQHERRKYLRRHGTASIARFVGFGRRGAAMHERALALHDAGFGARPRGLTHGFLEQDWIHGRPAAPSAPGLLNRMAEYLAFVGRTFATNEAESIDELHETISMNVASIRDVDRGAVDALAAEARGCDAPRVRVDGRMLPHEWIQDDARMMKVDALDHHDDHFWPGCRDIGWDVAGAVIEFELDRAQSGYLVRRYRRLSGDRSIALRLPFLEVAYLAYRFGYASLAAGALGDSADGVGFRSLKERYRRSLATRLAGVPVRV
jgi:hypothetical protein